MLVEAQDPPAAPVDPPVPDPATMGTPAPPVADPALQNVTDDPAADQAAPAETPPPADGTAPPPEEEKNSDVDNWQLHLPTVATEIQESLQSPVSIDPATSKTTPVAGNDPDLSYRISGVVQFPQGIPPDIAEKLRGRPLMYSVTVNPEGELIDASLNLFFTTSDTYEAGEEPIYHVNPNTYGS